METSENKLFYSRSRRPYAFGILLVLIGTVLLGLNFGFIPMQLHEVLISWPMLLITIGIWHFIRCRWFGGSAFFIAGGFFLIPHIMKAFPAAFPCLIGDFTHTFWPLLLIVAGILIVLSRIFKTKSCVSKWNSPHRHFYHHKHYKYAKKHYQSETVNDEYSKNSIFGSGEHIILDPEFKGGELNAVFGELILDLRRTTIPQGDTYLDINAVFGGIIIFVPVGWFVELRIEPVFGGFKDTRSFSEEVTDKTRKLIITGSCVFGGGELRN